MINLYPLKKSVRKQPRTTTSPLLGQRYYLSYTDVLDLVARKFGVDLYAPAGKGSLTEAMDEGSIWEFSRR